MSWFKNKLDSSPVGPLRPLCLSDAGLEEKKVSSWGGTASTLQAEHHTNSHRQ